MNKLHFTMLAGLIRTELAQDEPNLCDFAHAAADVFEATNPRFDRERFLRDAGVASAVAVA